MALDPLHRVVTIDTPKEEWVFSRYRVPMIRDVLIEHLSALALQPSGLQMRAMNRISMILVDDRRPEIANNMINWEAELPQITEDLDVLFFRGLITKDRTVKFRPVIGGMPTDRPGFSSLGYTRWDCPGSSDLIILFDTNELGPQTRLNRVQRRSKVLGTLCHEMVHAFYQLYSCKDVDCCLAVDGEYARLVAPRSGHGEAWLNVAKYINMLFVSMFPMLDYTGSPGWLFRPRPDGWQDTYRDAMGIVENDVPGILPPGVMTIPRPFM
ncbi:hypothetical protein PG997_008697 [Apiospora hydei]|uniref:SprT-like domain-containing protein n=1 Tax=Apiospora hydei TaxID=1337664 RepID=A0ABR1WBK5_9PEZI